jgi:hypothetical protein
LGTTVANQSNVSEVKGRLAVKGNVQRIEVSGYGMCTYCEER